MVFYNKKHSINLSLINILVSEDERQDANVSPSDTRMIIVFILVKILQYKKNGKFSSTILYLMLCLMFCLRFFTQSLTLEFIQR